MARVVAWFEWWLGLCLLEVGGLISISTWNAATVFKIYPKKTWLGFEFRSRLRARNVRVTSSGKSSHHQDSYPTYMLVAYKPFTRGVLSLSPSGIKAVHTHGIVHVVKYTFTWKILETCITSNTKQYQRRIENKCLSARRDRNRKWMGGNFLGLHGSFSLFYLFSRLPFCVLGGWGRFEDETLQIFTTWITKKKLNFLTEPFIFFPHIDINAFRTRMSLSEIGSK